MANGESGIMKKEFTTKLRKMPEEEIYDFYLNNCDDFATPADIEAFKKDSHLFTRLDEKYHSLSLRQRVLFDILSKGDDWDLENDERLLDNIKRYG